MMKIESATAVRASEAPKASGVPGATFRLPNEAGSSAMQSTAGAAAARGLDALLALQEAGAAVDDPVLRDREARRHGRKVLDALAALQKALLGGGGERDALGHLSALLGGMPQATDPQLAALLGSVGLRARIELARHGLLDGGLPATG